MPRRQVLVLEPVVLQQLPRRQVLVLLRGHFVYIVQHRQVSVVLEPVVLQQLPLWDIL